MSVTRGRVPRVLRWGGVSNTFLGIVKISSNIQIAYRFISSLATQIVLARYYEREEVASRGAALI